MREICEDGPFCRAGKKRIVDKVAEAISLLAVEVEARVDGRTDLRMDPESLGGEKELPWRALA